MDQTPELLLPMPAERPTGSISRVVGAYQIVLRRALEHFFPDGLLDVAGDRSIIDWDGSPDETYYRLRDDPDGLGVEIEWLGTHLAFQPGKPAPLLSTERRMVEVIVEAIDLRFRGLFNQEIAHRADRFEYQTEDLIVADYLDTVGSFRIPAALEALRAAALSTYENRRVSTGALLLGTDHDPTAPGYTNIAGAPSFTARLTAIKGFHRLCDGVRTIFLVDRQGDLARMIDVARWAEVCQGCEPLVHPCPRTYVSHAKATRSGGHVCLVLTPTQEIKVFAEGTLMFSFSDARWRLLDIPSKFAVWSEAVGRTGWRDLARTVFQAALNLSESRLGALFVVLRDPEQSIPQLIAPADQISWDVAADDPQDPENLSPKHAKRALHHVVRGMKLSDLEPSVLEAISCLDGAVVTDQNGRLITFGAILRIAPETLEMDRAVQGARTLAGLAASLHGPVLKVSEDGYLTMFLKGRRVWEL
jgi:DNA integrity scanning protein DisA with diadenylate cyclase activity